LPFAEPIVRVFPRWDRLARFIIFMVHPRRRVDLGLMAVAASYFNTLTAELALGQLRTYRPDVFMPAHHDAPIDGLWRAIEPLSEALKNDNPDIVTISKNYREPFCFNTEFNVKRGLPSRVSANSQRLGI
jgi:hypothetical protein